ncbi:MAG: SDR family oxidoreductase [Candidatus Melainabacteria bacterium]
MSGVAIITGASQGLGEAIAHKLAGRGLSLVLAARSETNLNRVAGELQQAFPGIQVLVAPTDVSDATQVEKLVQKTLQAFGRVDVLINNAGVAGKIALLQEISPEDIHRTIDITLKGAIFMMRAVLPAMVAQQSGTIININSVAGMTAYPYWSIYDAAKFGLRAVTEAVADEQFVNNIKVVGIYPGAVDTPIWETIDTDSDPNREGMLDAGSIADAVNYVLDQPAKLLVKSIVLAPLKPAL